MKKRSKKLRLNRETILKLEESELAKGGKDVTYTCGFPCPYPSVDMCPVTEIRCPPTAIGCG